jgi:tetratricopeptide (TPR) repeat protein
MKPLILTAIAVALSLLTILPFNNKSENAEAFLKDLNNRKLAAVSCSPDLLNLTFSDAEVAAMIPLPGTGSHKWNIRTSNDSAAFYFNQGMNLYYGFHIIEAIPSFKKAIQLDPDCAMLHWAEALAYGPNINDLGYAASQEALAATEQALKLRHSATSSEKMLIDAMAFRYSRDTSISRTILNERYAEAMAKAYRQFPRDAEIGALYADALMLLHPWDLWFQNGDPKPWTKEIVSVLEDVLKISPDHPGANHYYIHAVEASPYPGKATVSADKLGRLTPGLSHMVHMPSHIYIRTGEYKKGTVVNKQAVQQYQRYLNIYPGVAANAPLYDFHNRHMQAVCSMNGGGYQAALAEAIECRNSVDTSFLSLAAPLGPYVQYVYMTPEFTKIYFEKWKEILDDRIEYRHSHNVLIKQFAKGLAYANTGQLSKSSAALKELEKLIEDKDLALPFGPFNAPKAAAIVARDILKGTIAEKQGRGEQALDHFKSAVLHEDALIYNEPKDWILPARHFLGYALLSMKRFSEAEKVFREDLKYNPKNVKGEKGLSMAIGKKPAA